jgi:hypothetical protein
MPETGSPVRRALRRWRSGLALGLAWAVPLLLFRWPRVHAFDDWLRDAIIRVLSGFPALQVFALQFAEALQDALFATYGVSLFIATLAVPLGFVVRMIARSRLRAGHADPLDRARSWTGAHPGWTALLVAAGPVALQSLLLRSVEQGRGLSLVAWLVIAVAVGAAQWRVARGGLRALLAPTVEETDAAAADALDADEIHFDAVAVTRETRAAVGGLAALSVAAVAWMAALDIHTLYRDPRLFSVMIAYVVIAATSAVVFRRASRISVGVDGIRVGGTSRTRFFAYRDLDEARERGGDIELVKRGRVLLRLQLHGHDATRRGAILARMQGAIARVATVERDGAANFVSSARPGTVARAMRGGADYRVPAVSRDALWSLVEGAGVDGEARTAAARAIVEIGGAEERARLRVAATHCADPRVRVALEELADDEPPTAAEPLAAPRSSRA